MEPVPSSAGFRFPFSRKLSWRLKWSFQSPSPSWHPCLNISVIISCYSTESIEVFIAGHGYQERFAVVSSVAPHTPRVITSFAWKSKPTSSKIAAAALRLNILTGVSFPWQLHTSGCHFCYFWLPRDCPCLARIQLPEISISLGAEWSSNLLFQFWICPLKGQLWPYRNHLLFLFWGAGHAVLYGLYQWWDFQQYRKIFPSLWFFWGTVILASYIVALQCKKTILVFIHPSRKKLSVGTFSCLFP